MGSRSDSQVIGYRYLLGVHMGISRGPVDELVEIKAGDRYIWRGSVTDNTSVSIQAADVFGGEDGEGGIQGTLTTMFGGPTQTAPSVLTTIQEAPLPGFRRKMTVFFDGIISMINPYPKPWKFRVRRTNSGWDGPTWYPERARITLVRTVSEAEQQAATSGSGGTTTTSTTLTQQFDLTPQLVPIQQGSGIDATWLYTQPAPVTVTLVDQPGVTITSIDNIQYSNGGVGIDEVIQNLPSSAWSASGNTITIQAAPGGESDAYPRPYARQIVVVYTASVQTTVPVSGLTGFGVTVIAAMNPAHILYEVYTNREWGRGMPREALDDDNWRTAADVLFNERFGLCIRWTRTTTIKEFARLILDHINAAVFEDRVTGKIKLQLIRGNYDRQQVPIFTTETGLLEITDAPVLAQGPMINEIKVKYRDPVTDTERTVRASNLANLQASAGEINTSTIDMIGIPTAEIAASVAKRELKARSTRLRAFSLVLDRRASGVVPGGVIRIADPVRNIPDIVLRVGSVDYGTLREGKIIVKAVQDVFAAPARGVGTMPPPSWVPAASQPCLGPAAVFEMPYWLLARTLSQADLAQVADTEGYIGTVVGEGQSANLSYQVAIKLGAPLPDEQPLDAGQFCPLPSVQPSTAIFRETFTDADGTRVDEHSPDINIAPTWKWYPWTFDNTEIAGIVNNRATLITPLGSDAQGFSYEANNASANIFPLPYPHQINFTFNYSDSYSSISNLYEPNFFNVLYSLDPYSSYNVNKISLEFFAPGLAEFRLRDEYALTDIRYVFPYTSGQTYQFSLLVEAGYISFFIDGLRQSRWAVNMNLSNFWLFHFRTTGQSWVDNIEILI